jgi:L-iditol 2-dehydrogenase
MKMKAALMYGPNDIRVEKNEKPECSKDGLILKIMSVGLCESDIRNLTTDSRKDAYPFIYGHEIVGFVDEIGPDETKYTVVQRLFLFPGTYCMECDECISGHSENCSNTSVTKLAGTGGFAQYIAVSYEKIRRGGIYEIPDNVSFDAASLGEPLTSVFACLENVDVNFPDTLVIIGAGNGKGADKVISATPANATQTQSIHMARKDGLVVFFGGVPKESMTELDCNLIHYNNI